MLSLAQFALRGPLYASGVAALATALPLLFWVGAAVVALVILRLGISQGLNIGLWALLPALGWSWFGQDPTALWVLLHAVAMAIALRLTRTWEVTLLTGSGLGIVSGFLIPLLYPEMIGQLVEAGTSFYREYNPDIASQLGDRLEHLVREAMNASLAGTFLLLGMLSVMLGRAWQAGLFNPGGFREEFHAFRLSPAAAVICVGATVAGASVEAVPFLVSWAGALPLLMAGVALVHGVVGRRNLGSHWLVLFYVLMVLLSPSLMLLLLILAFVDSWLNFRDRLDPRKPAE